MGKFFTDYRQQNFCLAGSTLCQEMSGALFLSILSLKLPSFLYAFYAGLPLFLIVVLKNQKIDMMLWYTILNSVLLNVLFVIKFSIVCSSSLTICLP